MNEEQKKTLERVTVSLVLAYKELVEQGIPKMVASHDIAKLSNTLLAMLQPEYQREARGIMLKMLDEALTALAPGEIHVQFPEWN